VAIASIKKWMDREHGEDYNASSEYPASLFVGEYILIEQLPGMGTIAETSHVQYPAGRSRLPNRRAAHRRAVYIVGDA
jgi:hypothetical protein